MTKQIAVLVRWVELFGRTDPITGAYRHGGGRRGFSKSDQAAMESALVAAVTLDATVVVVSAAPAEAERDLVEFAATGATLIKRIDIASPELSFPIDELATATKDADLVLCGDLSADNGSGYLPPALAHKLGVVSALGLTDISVSSSGTIEVIRRLQRGYRERLSVELPAVLSVEATAGSLRRAPLGSLVGDGRVPIEVIEVSSLGETQEIEFLPWKPRTRELPAPTGELALDRIVELTGAMVERTPPRTVELSPDDAAEAILSQLREWGYLERG